MEETLGNLSAFYAMFPGNHKFNVFPLWLAEDHHARLSSVFAPHLGHPYSEDLDAEYLNIFETRTRTPFFQDVYVDGVRVMLILGPTGSGKTTLMKALLDHVPQHERLVVIEQPAELKMSHPNAVRWEAVEAIPGQVAITPSQLLAAALRHRPDRIIMGEIRDECGYDLLQAMNTGHGGTLSTIHAKSAWDALNRLSDLALSARANLNHAFIRSETGRGHRLRSLLRARSHGPASSARTRQSQRLHPCGPDASRRRTSIVLPPPDAGDPAREPNPNPRSLRCTVMLPFRLHSPTRL